MTKMYNKLTTLRFFLHREQILKQWGRIYFAMSGKWWNLFVRTEQQGVRMTSSGKVDGVFRMRSLGTATAGITDQYSDGKAAKVWQLYIGRYLLYVYYLSYKLFLDI